jgi:type IV secretory pathway TraG/TraD family ATPase VirD4
MNLLLELLESAIIGREPSTGDELLLDFGDGRLSRKGLVEGVLVMASIGRGKTTLLKTLMRGMLRDGFGGMIPVVKGSLIEEMRACVETEQRLEDLILFGPRHGHIFNPFEHLTEPTEAAALLAKLAEVLSPGRRDNADEQFWREQLAIVLRHLFTLCKIQHGRMELSLVAELFDGRANTSAEAADPIWQQTSPLRRAMETARRAGDPDALNAVVYFTKTYVSHGDRLQGSLAATANMVFDQLNRDPLRQLFSGRSTFTMDDVFDQGKICLVTLPVLDSAAGRVANALLQFCFCREAVRRPRGHYSFLVLDEGQELVTSELMNKLAVLREYKVAVTVLSQNLAVLDERLGEPAREGLCGLLGTKIFGPQGHAATRQWAAEQFGKRKRETASHTQSRTSGKQPGKSTSETTAWQWDYRVPPHRFAQLDVGETIVLRDDKIWRAKWHLTHPGRRGTVGIIDYGSR